MPPKQSVHYGRILLLRISCNTLIVLTLLLGTTGTSAEEPYRIAEFREIDREYLRVARERINQRCSNSFGTRFRGDKHHDLPLLQRLLDERRVTREELALLQGMGVILGDILRKEYPLDWVRYIDAEGSSRALQLRHQQHFIFPITAISRRAAVDAPVDVKTIYQNMRDPVTAAYER